jgi:hypothetical protein
LQDASARAGTFSLSKKARIMKNTAEKINANRLGNGRIQEEENDQVFLPLWDLIVSICCIGTDDVLDL